MSNLSLKAALREDKFNLKIIIILFILLDIFLFPVFLDLRLYKDYLYLLLYESSLILGLMFGLRGQGKFRQVMINLESIARNQKLSVDEREHQLVMGVHHHMLELGYIYEERNRLYGLFKRKKNGTSAQATVPKKTKNSKEVKKMVEIIWIDETVWKQIGYAIAGIWFFIGLAILDSLYLLGWRLLWVAMIVGIWYVIDGLIIFYIHYIFKLPQPKPRPKPPMIVNDPKPIGTTQPG